MSHRQVICQQTLGIISGNSRLALTFVPGRLKTRSGVCVCEFADIFTVRENAVNFIFTGSPFHLMYVFGICFATFKKHYKCKKYTNTLQR